MLTEKGSSSSNGGHRGDESVWQSESSKGSNSGNALKKKTSLNSSTSSGPAGGFDETPIPSAPPGYTVKITFHRAENLPISDISTFSSDPFILAQMNTSLPPRHKEDPHIRLRTPTIHRSTNPQWNCEWIIANVPSSGFKLKVRVYDEDTADHDDRLGNAHVIVPPFEEDWQGIHNQCYKLKKRMGSKRAYLLRGVAVCLGHAKHMSGFVYISVEVLERTPGEDGGRCYTLGPLWWTKHYSPLLGRITGKVDTDLGEKGREKCRSKSYNFQANQMQLQGPVPAQMYHRYVEFKPFVKAMFTSRGVKGFLLSKALHHQHGRVYNFDHSTEWGRFNEPCREMTLQFLELVHYDRGGRIFTYVLTLDSLFRFTETGKEFGIDMLSKHTMHSDVSIYVAFSGEFFIRRLKHPRRRLPEEGGHNKEHPPEDLWEGADEEAPKDPTHYEIIIDNDSGTYRPNAKLLPLLKEFIERQFPGLRVVTLDSQGDAERMQKMKNEQRERKKEEGNHIVYTQVSDIESLSSSDEEALDALEREGYKRDRGLLSQMQREIAAKGQAKQNHLKTMMPHMDLVHSDTGLDEKQGKAPEG
ncbi:hypothetical protein M501DRAFT_1005587 [Patellaria atrata CBS 101060]|uniref:C2 domain-containing protein n=1 Tax=Patellaria atrata CBS 101060 TaxID=1346257 RepID=A0A9P4VT92_9PEZI|nr:hypothetical protein M501DRAFT_1005587 [Patellaria atrata CBS 101060]